MRSRELHRKCVRLREALPFRWVFPFKNVEVAVFIALGSWLCRLLAEALPRSSREVNAATRR